MKMPQNVHGEVKARLNTLRAEAAAGSPNWGAILQEIMMILNAVIPVIAQIASKPTPPITPSPVGPPADALEPHEVD